MSLEIEILARAKDLEKVGKFEEAITQYERGIQQSPSSTIYYLKKASVLQTLNKDQEAIDVLAQAVEKSKTDKTLIPGSIATIKELYDLALSSNTAVTRSHKELQKLGTKEHLSIFASAIQRLEKIAVSGSEAMLERARNAYQIAAEGIVKSQRVYDEAIEGNIQTKSVVRSKVDSIEEEMYSRKSKEYSSIVYQHPAINPISSSATQQQTVSKERPKAAPRRVLASHLSPKKQDSENPSGELDATPKAQPRRVSVLAKISTNPKIQNGLNDVEDLLRAPSGRKISRGQAMFEARKPRQL